MPHYAIVTLVVKNSEKLKAYQAVGGPAVAKHGGKAFAGGPQTRALRQPHGPTKGVVLEFPSEAHLSAWLEDPELNDVHTLREEAAEVTILSVPAIV